MAKRLLRKQAVKSLKTSTNQRRREECMGEKYEIR